MSYPSELMYGLRSIDGVSHASFKVPAQTTNDLTANAQVRFSLPSNSIVDLRKVRMVFNITTGGAAGLSRIPPLHSLIQRIQITAGGVPISQGCANQHLLTQALQIVHPRDEGDIVDGHPEIYRARSGITGVDIAAVDEGYDLGDATVFELSLGAFMDSVEPRMLSTDLLPQVEIELFLNSNAVIPQSNNIAEGDYAVAANQAVFTSPPTTPDATFTMKNYSLIVPCYSVMDGMYEAMLDAVIQRQEYLPVAYKEYYSYSDVFSGTSQFSNGSSCLNRLIAVTRASTANTQGAPIIVQGYKSKAVGDAAGTGTPAQLPDAEHHGEKYVSPALNFEAPMTTLPSVADAAGTTANALTAFTAGFPKLVYRVNSVSLPNFNVPLTQCYGVTKRAYDVDKTMSKSMLEYLNNRFVFAINLGLPNESVRVKSGLNMRGSSSTIRLECPDTTNLDTSHLLQVFMDTTAELRIGAGKQLAIIN